METKLTVNCMAKAQRNTLMARSTLAISTMERSMGGVSIPISMVHIMKASGTMKRCKALASLFGVTGKNMRVIGLTIRYMVKAL